MYTECTRRDRSQPGGGVSASGTSRLSRAVHFGRRREIRPHWRLSSDWFASTGLLIRWSLVRVQHGSLTSPGFAGLSYWRSRPKRASLGRPAENVHGMYTPVNGMLAGPGKRCVGGSGTWVTLSGRGSGTWATLAPVPRRHFSRNSAPGSTPAVAVVSRTGCRSSV